MIACYLRITLVVSRTIYQESFAKENFHDMSIVTAFANLVIQLKFLVITDVKIVITRKCSQIDLYLQNLRTFSFTDDSRYTVFDPLVVETDCFTNLHTNLLMSPAEGR